MSEQQVQGDRITRPLSFHSDRWDKKGVAGENWAKFWSFIILSLLLLGVQKSIIQQLIFTETTNYRKIPCEKPAVPGFNRLSPYVTHNVWPSYTQKSNLLNLVDKDILHCSSSWHLLTHSPNGSTIQLGIPIWICIQLGIPTQVW